MKTILFTVINWDNSTEADRLKDQLNEWEIRSRKYISPDSMFMVAGSYSRPEYNPTGLKLIQTHIDKQFYPDQPINYWKCGLMMGLQYALLQKEILNWDMVIYHHYSVLISKDMTDVLNKFLDRREQICSPQSLTTTGSLIDTGLMIMKFGGVQKWILNSGSYSKIINNRLLSVEEEATVIFDNEWHNPFHNVVTMHKTEPNINNSNMMSFNSRFNLSMDNFIHSDMIYGSVKHCSKYELDKWKELHPIN